MVILQDTELVIVILFALLECKLQIFTFYLNCIAAYSIHARVHNSEREYKSIYS